MHDAHTVEACLPHMPLVLRAERALHDQTVVWQTLEVSTAIGCADQADTLLPTLSATRDRFGRLQQRLVDALAHETLGAVADELEAAAQCSIDILVRNLFERTADVGFLATDPLLQQFCLHDDAGREAAAPALRQRLQAYRAKYSVYDDVAVLSLQGRVWMRLDGAVGGSADEPLLGMALARAGHAEAYGHSALAADGAPALRYAHRILDAAGRPVGVLVLRFRFADEMHHIFERVLDPGDATSVLLLDAQACVVAASDPTQWPAGTRLAPGRVRSAGDASARTPALLRHGGREYLAVHCQAQAYQGYPGPGWQACALLPLASAFPRVARAAPAAHGGEAHTPVPTHATLRAIQREVDAINRNLRRVVWNGRLSAAAGGTGEDGAGGPPGLTGLPDGIRAEASAATLKAALHQVSLAGTRMRECVGQAVADLSRAVLRRSGRQAVRMAELAAEILDRNLYERANDCRWWALSPVLREGLAGETPGAAAAMAATLQEIHALYTVYQRLVVFNRQGVVMASSLPDDRHSLCGQAVPADWCQRTLALAGDQAYAASGFEASILSDGEPDLVYLACVRHPQTEQALGGIAIVFHTTRECAAMLRDVLGGREGRAAFIDRQGRVLARCGADAQSTATLVDAAADVGRLVHGGQVWAQGVAPSRGYREYLRSDGHGHNPARDPAHADPHALRAVVQLPLGRTEAPPRPTITPRVQTAALDAGRNGRHSGHPGQSGQAHLLRPLRHLRPLREVAVFAVGDGLYALPRERVLEACSADGLVRAPTGQPHVIGLMAADRACGSMLPVLCAHRLLGASQAEADADPAADAGADTEAGNEAVTDADTPAHAGVVLVLCAGPGSGRAVGLRVDDVQLVLEVPPQQVQTLPDAMRRRAPWLQAVIRADADTHASPRTDPQADAEAGTVLVQLLDADALCAVLQPATATG